MTAVELKNLLIHRISEINDVAFLRAIKTILDSKANTRTLPLTPQQQEDIGISKKEIDQELFISQNDLDLEIDVWLKEK